MVAIAIAGDPALVAPAHPFRGIQPFRYADHEIFFARDDETHLLARLVAVYRGVFLYGDSGNGKSSLVSAGLLPQALALGFDPVQVRVQPRDGEELVVERIPVADDADDALALVLAEDGDDSARIVLSIAEFEERVRATCDARRPLIVFDQFEEILTLFDEAGAAGTRGRVVEMIVRLIDDPLPVKLLFAFREDYLGRVKQLLEARPELVDQALRLGPPNADALDDIIRGPFKRFPGRFQPELGPELAQRVAAALAERFGSGEVSLSEVQTVCLRLWESGDPEALLAEKGIQGLLEDELGEALEAFSPDLRAAAIALLSQMVTPAGTRNVISAEDLRQRVRGDDADVSPALLDEALERLERESKLVRRERRRDLYLYEITSEFLVPWISRRREELRVAQARRRERRRLRIVAAIAGALLLVAALVAALAVWALRQRDEARSRASENVSLALVSSSAQPLGTRPDISLALAYEAYRERPHGEATAAVVRALDAARRAGLRGVLDAGAPVSKLAMRPNGGLATVGFDGTVLVWDSAKRRRPGRLGPPRLAYGVAIAPDGRSIATAGQDGTLRLWDLATRRQIGRPLTSSVGEHVAFSPDGRLLAGADEDGSIRLWDPATRRQVRRLAGRVGSSPPGLSVPGGQGGILNALVFSRDGRTIVARDLDGMTLWETSTGDRRRFIAAPVNNRAGVAMSPDGRTLASTSGDTVDLRSAVTGARTGRLAGSSRALNALAFSPDGETLATAGSDRTVNLWDVGSRRPVARFAGHDAEVTAVGFTSTGRTLVSADFNGGVRLWNPETRVRPARLADPAGPVLSVAFSPDGRTLATVGVAFDRFLQTVRLWSLSTGRQLHALADHAAVAFRPRSRTVAAAGAGGSVVLRDLDTWRIVGRLPRGTSNGSLAFSSDGRRLATGGLEGVLTLWDPATRRRVGASFGRQPGSDLATVIGFSPDGTLLAASYLEGGVRLWSTRTRRQVVNLPTRGGEPAFAFSQDGRTLAVADRTAISAVEHRHARDRGSARRRGDRRRRDEPRVQPGRQGPRSAWR